MASVERFLSVWRGVCEREIQIIRRSKNLEGIAELGLTMEQAKEVLKNLDINDYYRGPEKDHNPVEKGEVWIFRKRVSGAMVYIKVKIAQKPDGSFYAKCISFHPWEGGDEQ